MALPAKAIARAAAVASVAVGAVAIAAPAAHASGMGPRDRQLRALQAELSGSCAPSQDPERATYAGLGDRIEQLLGLAEEQASALIEAARAEAAGITAPAGTPQLCPRCGGTLTEPEVTTVRTQTAPPE